MIRHFSRRVNLTGRCHDPLGKSLVPYSTASGGRRGRLDGKVALIIGGAGGLGKASAVEFVKEGAAAVIIADINAVGELGPRSSFIQCDVTIEKQISDAVDFAVSQHGRLDVLHNCAGVTGPSGPSAIADLDLDQFDRVMAVNVRGTVAGIKHAARVMSPIGSGSILCMSSISGILGGLGPHPYSISKFTIPGIVRSAAGELCRNGVRVNCISPFAVPTPLVVDQFAEFYRGLERERIVEIIEGLGELRGAKCEEIDVAKAAVYLASDEAKYVSGHNLVVDGGFTAFKHLNLPVP